MANPITTGVIDTEALLVDEKVVDMQDEFRMLTVDEAQFSTITNRLPTKPAIREKVNWLEDDYVPDRSTIGTAVLVGDAAMAVATGTGTYFAKYDLWRNTTTGEVVEVTTTPAADSVAITRSIGRIPAAGMSVGHELIRIGSAYPQWGDLGDIKIVKRILGYNQTQIYRTPLGFAGTEIEIETYGEGDPMHEITKKAVEHQMLLENSWFFGARDFVVASPNSKGYMGGMYEFVQTNVFPAQGAMTRAKIDTRLTAAFQYGTNDKVIFAAPQPAAWLSGLVADNWVQAPPGTRVYNSKVDGFISGAYGTNVPIIVKKQWGRYGATGEGIGTMMMIVDMGYVRRRPMRNRGTQLLRNRQSPGRDGVIHEYLTETSMEVAQELTHAITTGWTVPV